jgi:hypothetical protein
LRAFNRSGNRTQILDPLHGGVRRPFHLRSFVLRPARQPMSIGSAFPDSIGKFPDFDPESQLRLNSSLRLRKGSGLSSLVPTDSSHESFAWPPDVLNHGVRELRREFPTILPERIVRSVDIAARFIRPDSGHVRLLQSAREALRRDF